LHSTPWATACDPRCPNRLIGTHLIPRRTTTRIPEVRAASLLALMRVFDLVGTTGTGWLSDGWRSRHLLAWY
jgi:hypothetical protein